MSNLLDLASIVLTPTAYNNGEALCIKPDDASGDFQFSRNSAATRVNAQGLVENVQILSSNLVQNGDFSEEGVQEVSNGSFSQEGSELITNGDFATDSDWDGQATISNGQLTKNDNGLVRQYTLDVSVKSYKVIVDVEILESSLSVYLGGVNQLLSQGVNTIYMQSGGSNNLVGFNNGANSVINSISCVEVGQDWTLGTGWSIGENKAVRVSTGTYTPITQGGILTAGKSYKVNYTINDGSVGGVRVQLGGTYSGDYNGVGTHTVYGVAGTSDFNNFKLVGEPSFNGSITNISVKEVGQNWDFVGDFEIGNNQSLITNASQYSQITQQSGSTFLTANRLYKLSADIPNLSISNALAYRVTGGAVTPISTSQVVNGKFETEFIMPSNGYLWFQTTGSYTGLNATITNISVIEITTDTSLPRINYEGFSYQDALGSEEIVNGDFSNGSANWTLGTGWSIGNSVAIRNNVLTNTAISQSLSLISGKTYEFNFTVNSVTGTGSVYTPSTAETITTYTTTGNKKAYFTPSNTQLYILGWYGIGSAEIEITNISVKEYLGQEVVPDSGCGSWLFEPQSTNLITYSEDFSQSFWTKSSVTLTSGFTAPDGSNNAYKVEGTIGTSYLANLTVNTDLRSIYVRTVSGTGQVKLLGNTTLYDVNEQWTRVSYSPTSNTYQFAVDFRGGTDISEVLIWGAQVEQQSYATSYIPTNGEANGVTRNQDVCTNGGSLASINSTEGVLYAEIAALANDGTSRRISLLESLYDRVSLVLSPTSNSIQGLVLSGGSVQFNQTFSISNTLDFNKIAFKYKTNDFAIWVNGVEVATDTSGNTPIGLSELSFADGDNTSNKFFGKTKCLAVWKEALSDQELTELTTI